MIIGAYANYQLVALSRQSIPNALQAAIVKDFEVLAYVTMQGLNGIEVLLAPKHRTHFFPMKPRALVEKMALADS